MIDSLSTIYPWANQWPTYDPAYNLSVVTAPAVEPVQYTDMVAQCRLDQDDDQSLVTALAVAGRWYVESITNLTLVATTYQVQFDSFDSMLGLRLPRRPVIGVPTVTYLDQTGTSQTLSTNAYTVDTKVWTRIRPTPNTVFPVSQLGQPNAITVSFVAGASTDGVTNVNPLAKLAIQLWAAAQYENREAVNTGKSGMVLPHGFDAIITMLSAPEVG